jgi:hypothetical protein
VKDEYFSFAVYIDEIKKEIYSVVTQSRNPISFTATSDTMTVDEMLSLTKLKATETWSKGDTRFKKLVHKVSGVAFEPNPEPDEFEDKLKQLLFLLQQDKEGVSFFSVTG